MKPVALVLLVASSVGFAQQYTRGIGVYPGNPREYMGPTLRMNATDRGPTRNLALHRAAYQSSAYDYNLTAQLVTDGITETGLPGWIVASTSDQGELAKTERGVFLDGNVTSSVDVTGDAPWVEFDMEGGGIAPELDRIDLYVRKLYGPLPGTGWTFVVTGSQDGAAWTEVARSVGTAWPDMREMGPSVMWSIPFARAAHFRRYRVQLSAEGIHKWGVAELVLFDKGSEVRVAGPEHFHSAWMSAGSGEEWVYVDLGAVCAIDRVKLAWIERAKEGAVQVSDDAKAWKTVQALPGEGGNEQDLKLARTEHGRYVRVLMTRPAEAGARYILSELEVYGRGGVTVVPGAGARAQADGTLKLEGGGWRVQEASLVEGDGERISTPGYAAEDWMTATVPGTVLTSYLNDGAIAHPDFGDNQYTVSDSFFCADFWYRDEFRAPAELRPGQHFWLDFDGINWKAEVYLNGRRLGSIDGGFMRGRFDVTGLVHAGGMNALAVRILRNANPGGTKDKAAETVNGGALGRDNPTYHASAGWDWMSTIRGRNTGIWSDVTLRQTGSVIVQDPLVTTTLPLPDTSQADVRIEATLRNLEDKPVSGVFRARFGTVMVETPVTVPPGTAKVVDLTPERQAALHLVHPKLWWPVGYGEPNLYPVRLEFAAGGHLTDATEFQTGVREFTYSEDGGALRMWINGRRFIARGGNWGFPESMLRYRAREYETALEYHRDEHFNMIRNWVGQTGDEAFYQAADRNGVVVWQDFWLANPWDGPNPDDNDLFLKNARDYLLRIRNHASLGLFCGRNEGYPPQPIDDGLFGMVKDLVPGMHYISSSADGPVSGHGPYRVEPLRYYFEHAPEKFHSEMGSPNVVEMDSLRRTMPAEAMWPQGSQWLLHDYYPKNPFTQEVDEDFGGAGNIEDWDGLAQFVDYDAYRGMYEGQSRNRMGLLIWMSHPAWPSLLWQTYDYFFDTDAGYYGAKKGAEPFHIQWNAATDAVEVVNSSAGQQTGLTAEAQVLDLDGTVKWEKKAQVDSSEDSTVSPFKMEFPAGLAETHFIRLRLMRGDEVVSRNFYLHGVKEQDYKGIRTLARVKVAARTKVVRSGDEWRVTTELENVGHAPALMVRVKAVREKTGDPILPALYDDNYIALMPGEKRTIHVRFLNSDTRGEAPRLVVTGYNVTE